MRSWTVTIAELCPHSHFWSFGLVLSIEELGESPSLDSMDGIVVKPGRVAGDDDVMGLFCHIVLIFLLPFGIILHSFLFTSILPYQLQYQKNTLGLFFLTLCRDHFTPTLGQKSYLVSSLLIHVHDGPTFDWLVLAVLVTTVTASCFNKNKNVARKHFSFFLTFLHYPIEFQQHFGTFQCLTTYIVWRVEPPVYWSLGEGLPCPGSDHHLCLPYSASFWNSPVLQVFLC